MIVSNFWLFGEFLVLSILLFQFILMKSNVVRPVLDFKSRCLLFSGFIVLVSTFYYWPVDAVKMVIYMSMIFLSYKLPKSALIIILALLLIESLLSINVFDKYNRIPFFLIAAIVVAVFDFETKTKKEVTVVLALFALSLVTAVEYQSRTEILSLFLFLFVLLFSGRAKSSLINVVIALPIAYIVFSFLYYQLADIYDLEVSISNVERSTMIFWGVENFFSFEYLLKGPGREAFQIESMRYLFHNVKDEVATDPHSMIVNTFISMGSIGTALISITYFYLLFSIKKRNLKPVDVYLLVKLSFVVSLATFSAENRVLSAILLGYLMSLNMQRESGHAK